MVFTVVWLIADGNFYALAMDWITGNLYVASRGGYIVVCSAAIPGPLNGTTIVNSRDGPSGIALSPNDGYVGFWAENWRYFYSYQNILISLSQCHVLDNCRWHRNGSQDGRLRPYSSSEWPPKAIRYTG